jgi:hypothetical protein
MDSRYCSFVRHCDNTSVHTRTPISGVSEEEEEEEEEDEGQRVQGHDSSIRSSTIISNCNHNKR